MRRNAAICLFALVALAPSYAETRWIRVQSPNFDMYTSASERTARDTLQQFEQVRAFFLSSLSKSKEKPAPVRIVAFNSLKEYEPYRFNEVAIAYYHPGTEHDTIVMSHAGSETFPTAIHEYVHLVIHESGFRLPTWLNEGLADFYSTLHPVGGKIMIGDLIPGRYQALLRDKWVPLPVILAADQHSPYYNEKNKAGALYDESWALVHMLVLSPEYRPKWEQFMLAMVKGEESVQALTSTYGKPLGEIQRDLQDYLHGDRFRALIVNTKLEKENLELAPQPVPDLDLKVVLLDLADQPGKEEQTLKTLQDLVAEQPNRPEPYAELGNITWRRGNSAEAEKDFAKAYALGDRSPNLLWDYGRLAESPDPKNAAVALKQLLDAEPERIDVRLELAAAQLNARQPVQAVGTLAPIKSITPELASRLFMLQAYADIAVGSFEDAKNAAQRWRENARDAADTDRAQALIASLERRSQPRANITPASPPQRVAAQNPPAEKPGERPTENNDQPPPTPAQPAPAKRLRLRDSEDWQSITGSFVEFVCGKVPIVVLSTDSGKKRFAIDNPETIVVTGRESGHVDLNCGPQKPASVHLEFDPRGSFANVQGVVRELDFQP